MAQLTGRVWIVIDDHGEHAYPGHPVRSVWSLEGDARRDFCELAAEALAEFAARGGDLEAALDETDVRLVCDRWSDKDERWRAAKRILEYLNESGCGRRDTRICVRVIGM